MPQLPDRRSCCDGAQERYYASVVWLPPPDRTYCFSRNGYDTFDTFRQMIRFARRANIDLRLFLDPIHGRLMLALEDAGLLPLYQDWKRRLVQILAEESRESGRHSVPLWDFSGFNRVTTEPVPPSNDRKTKVRWFWEPAHYKKETGNLILDRVLNYTPAVDLIPDDFGVLLTPANVDQVLEGNIKNGAEYSRREPDDAALVKSVISAVTKDAKPFACRDS